MDFRTYPTILPAGIVTLPLRREGDVKKGHYQHVAFQMFLSLQLLVVSSGSWHHPFPVLLSIQICHVLSVKVNRIFLLLCS